MPVTKIVEAERQVIENKLLDSLSKDGVVAVLMDEKDLREVLQCLDLGKSRGYGRATDLHRDYTKLFNAAFPV